MNRGTKGETPKVINYNWVWLNRTIITKQDILICARQMSLPDALITDDFYEKVKENALAVFPSFLQAAICFTLKD
jgi:hypothetical protein